MFLLLVVFSLENVFVVRCWLLSLVCMSSARLGVWEVCFLLHFFCCGFVVDVVVLLHIVCSLYDCLWSISLGGVVRYHTDSVRVCALRL